MSGLKPNVRSVVQIPSLPSGLKAGVNQDASIGIISDADLFGLELIASQGATD
jgi:hypothetical protein